MRKPLIAVVDDDPSIVKSLARMLRAAGYGVAVFGSAKDFLASLDKEAPQCLVADVHMPETSGLELQDQLERQGAALPVILMTAHETDQAREHARRPGSFGLLLKPFSSEALLRAIRQSLVATGF